MQTIENYLSEKNKYKALEECIKNGFHNLFFLLNYFTKENFVENKNPEIISKNKIKILLLCNWCSTEELTKIWNKMSKGNYTWNNIQLVTENPDYWVIINSPPHNISFDKKRSIVFQMEPNMNKKNSWGEWSNPSEKEFFKVFKHENEYNNNEWHLSKSYSWFLEEKIEKDEKLSNILSVVLSSQYKDYGHVKRVDFIKFLESRMTVHVFGDNKWNYINYKGSLPYHCKDDAIFPYKYTFNAENNEIKNYYTEKLIDGILGECLTFYWGCPNIRELINPMAYVQLELSNFEKDFQTIKKAIEEDWHTKRLPFIKEEKKRILNNLQFFPRIENLFSTRIENLFSPGVENKFSPKSIYIQLYNGLCNRLLPLFSVLNKNRKVYALWMPNPSRCCLPYNGDDCHFNELFQPIDNLEFVSHEIFETKKEKVYDFDYRKKENPEINFSEDTDITIIHALSTIPNIYDLQKSGIFSKDNLFFDLQNNFRKLKPIKFLEDSITKIKSSFSEKMIGIHIRRTDGSFSENKWEKADKYLINTINSYREKGYGIFLATDDEKYENKFGNVIMYKTENKYENSKNNTFSAVVDLFLLSFCNEIYSTAGSTFGLVACLLSKNSILHYVSHI